MYIFLSVYLFVNVLRRVHGFMAHHGQVQTWSARRRDRNDTGFVGIGHFLGELLIIICTIAPPSFAPPAKLFLNLLIMTSAKSF